jgi:hypothetical protein
MRLFRNTMLALMFVTTGWLAVAHAQKKPPTDPALLTIASTGAVLHSPGVTAIFWGAEWTDAGFADDIITGLDSLFAGFTGSTYARTVTEYYDRTGQVTPYTTYFGHLIDTSAAPAPGGLTSATAIAEVCKATNNNPNSSDVYVVFASTDNGTGACGFHTWGTCGSKRTAVPVQVAAIPYASGVAGTGCDALQDTETGHSLALAQIANIAIHELVETITDPRGTGWRDGFGDEMSDKCIRVFPESLGLFPIFSNGSTWKLQGQWSNAAYRARSGAPNELGQFACIW